MNRVVSIIGFVLIVIACGVLVNDARDASTAFASVPSTGYKEEVGIGPGAAIVNPTTAAFLNVPLGAQHAWITIKNNPACFRYDGVAPTAAVSGELPVGVWHVPNDRRKLQNMQFINCAEGATTIKVYYSRDRRILD